MPPCRIDDAWWLYGNGDYQPPALHSFNPLVMIYLTTHPFWKKTMQDRKHKPSRSLVAYISLQPPEYAEPPRRKTDISEYRTQSAPRPLRYFQRMPPLSAIQNPHPIHIMKVITSLLLVIGLKLAATPSHPEHVDSGYMQPFLFKFVLYFGEEEKKHTPRSVHTDCAWSRVSNRI